jgi:hypothetical protein
MSVHVFDPRECRPEEYRSKYPELKKIPEYTDLHVRELIFVWWMANPTSPLVKKVKNMSQRVFAAQKESGYNPGKEIIKQMMEGSFQEKIALAMERMGKIDVSVRDRARQMIEDIMNSYETIIKESKGKKDTDSDEKKKFVDLTAKIADNLPMLIEKLEIGFGVTRRGKDDEDAQEGTAATSFDMDFYTDNQNQLS